MTVGREDHCTLLGYDSQLYCLGGCDQKGNITNSCERYDFSSNKW
jgi:hypothetical protein